MFISGSAGWLYGINGWNTSAGHAQSKKAIEMRKIWQTENAVNTCIAVRAACAALLISAATLAHAGEPIPGVDVELGKNVGGIAAPGKAPAATPSISDQGAASNLSSYKAKTKCPANGSCSEQPGGEKAPSAMGEVSTSR